MIVLVLIYSRWFCGNTVRNEEIKRENVCWLLRFMVTWRRKKVQGCCSTMTALIVLVFPSNYLGVDLLRKSPKPDLLSLLAITSLIAVTVFEYIHLYQYFILDKHIMYLSIPKDPKFQAYLSSLPFVFIVWWWLVVSQEGGSMASHWVSSKVNITERIQT